MPVKINSFQHLGIPVTNLQNSIHFYERLGFQSAMDSAFDMNGRQGQVAMMKRDTMIIEIYQFPEPEVAEIASRRNGHVDHMAFDVDDIHETFRQLKEEGYKLLETEPVFLPFWKNGCTYFNIEGPDGERLEFNQIH